MNFKVGDIIKGKNKRYMFTNESMKKAKVLKVNLKKEMRYFFNQGYLNCKIKLNHCSENETDL